MKRLLISLVCGLMLASGCATLSNTAAVTVDGESLSVKDLNAIANSALIKKALETPQSPLQSTLAGSYDGSTARWVIEKFVETGKLKRMLVTLGGEITPEDRSAAADAIAGLAEGSAQQEPLPLPTKATRKLLAEYFAAGTAVDRVIADPKAAPSAREIQTYYLAHEDDFAEFVCVDGIQVLSEDLLDAVVAARVAGSPFDDIADELNAGGQQQAQSLTGSPCVSAAQFTTADPLGQALLMGPLNQDAPISLPDPERPFYGVLRVNKRGALTPEDPQGASQISEALQAEAAEKLPIEARASLRVEIDPRYGTWDPDSATGVVAPTKPRPEKPETTLDPLTVSPQG